MTEMPTLFPGIAGIAVAADDKYAPITSSIGFVKSTAKKVVEEFEIG